MILVTGGAGYIGSHVIAALLQSGYEVVNVDDFSRSHPIIHKNLEEHFGIDIPLYQIDLADARAFKELMKIKEPIDAVIHLAAYKFVEESYEDPALYYNNNIPILLHLLDDVHQVDVQYFIFSSSCTVYGEPDEIPVTEKSPLKEPVSPYGHTKQICEYILKNYAVAYRKMKVVSLRYFNPIGAHPDIMIGEIPTGQSKGLLPYLWQSVDKTLPELTIYGKDYPTYDGTPMRDYIHIVDLAQAHVASLDQLFAEKINSSYEVINVGLGKGYTVLEVINTFEKVVGLDVPHKFGNRRKGDISAIYTDNKKMKELLGFVPKYNLEDMLVHSWLWYNNYKNHIKPWIISL